MAGGRRVAQMGHEDGQILGGMLDATAAQAHLIENLERVLEEAREAFGYQRKANGRFVRAKCPKDTVGDLEAGTRLRGLVEDEEAARDKSWFLGLVDDLEAAFGRGGRW